MTNIEDDTWSCLDCTTGYQTSSKNTAT